MRTGKYLNLILWLVGIVCCVTTRANADIKQEGHSQPTSISAVKEMNDTNMIHSVYDKFVFAIDTNDNDNPEDYFTDKALKKLEDDYEFDCEDGRCFAFYELRTPAQDSKPGTEGESMVKSVRLTEDGWYNVSYLDMGWEGKTRIKTVNGKIDMYERCVSDL